MDVDLVVIDGPNLFSRVAERVRELAGGDLGLATEYMRDWFDIDRLVASTLKPELPPKLGIVVFHSLRQLGRDGTVRIAGNQDVDAFWARQAALPN